MAAFTKTPEALFEKRVNPEQFEFLMEQAAMLIQKKLPEYFPGRDLSVVRDGKRFKITGDFSLGDLKKTINFLLH
jgi:hypothetical protein